MPSATPPGAASWTSCGGTPADPAERAADARTRGPGIRAVTLATLLGVAAAGSSVAAPAHAAAAPQQAEGVPQLPPDWQQEVSYTVEARLDEEAGVLRAAQTVRYRNASPDTLRRLYFHLYLNAFRPHSLWARNEERPEYDFGALEEPDYGFERLSSVELREGPAAAAAGRPERERRLTPRYPHAPDSTVVRLDLPEALPPGGEITLRMAWTSRPSTLCRRQCRQGRHFDFAQWYPRVAVYDRGGWQAHPLYPQGEFYGEFATYDVTLDLATDQVVGATGVPVEGDPGWEPAESSPRPEPLYQRDWYGVPDPGPSPGFFEEPPGAHRKRVRFHARDVHHFAWSASPDYVYEGDVYDRGELPDVAIHVLYRPGDEGWAGGAAVERTVRSLTWLATVFRPYPYPQLTNLHRLEGGGTEFPMVVMNGSASQGLIQHEATHQYAHGILANNEWKEAWLDEGLTSFLDGWYAEEHGGARWDRRMEFVGRLEGVWNRAERPDPLPPYARRLVVPGSDTLPQPMPVASRSEDFAHYGHYSLMSYTKPSVVFYMLREMLGKETTRRVLQTYYDRYAFRHVNEAAFRGVAEEVSGRELDWFFDQWLHSTATLDYRVEAAETRQADDGSWHTRVEVVRDGEAWMPVTLAVDGARRRLTERFRRRAVTVTTEERPGSVELDPDRVLLDTAPGNNRTALGGE